jgi:hypothetical protein
MSRLPHFRDNRQADGGELSPLSTGCALLPTKIPDTHFCYRLSKPHAIMWLEGLYKLKKANNLIGNRTQFLPMSEDYYMNMKSYFCNCVNKCRHQVWIF